MQPEPVALDRQATIILGPPAAGKSTIAEDFAIFNKAAIIDSDEIKKSIPEFDNGIGAAAVHEESSDLSKALMAGILKSGRNVVIPKVGDKASSILKQIQLLKDNGYTVFLIDMSVTPQNAKLRMYGRFVSNGRLIPPSYVDAVGNLPSGVYLELKQQGAADGFAQIDNNGKFGAARPITDKSGQDFLAGSSLDMAASGGKISGTPDGRATEPSQAVSGEVSPRGEAPVTSQVSEMQSAIMDELQPDDMISVGLMQDANGNIVSQTMTMAEIKTMMDAEDKFIEQLGICGI
jgi:predicted ABC-type ATPase